MRFLVTMLLLGAFGVARLPPERSVDETRRRLHLASGLLTPNVCERGACTRLRALYLEGQNQRLPALLARLNFLENQLGIPSDQRLTSLQPDHS